MLVPTRPLEQPPLAAHERTLEAGTVHLQKISVPAVLPPHHAPHVKVFEEAVSPIQLGSKLGSLE